MACRVRNMSQKKNTTEHQRQKMLKKPWRCSESCWFQRPFQVPIELPMAFLSGLWFRASGDTPPVHLAKMVDLWGVPKNIPKDPITKAEFPMVQSCFSYFFITFGGVQSHGDTRIPKVMDGLFHGFYPKIFHGWWVLESWGTPMTKRKSPVVYLHSHNTSHCTDCTVTSMEKKTQWPDVQPLGVGYFPIIDWCPIG